MDNSEQNEVDQEMNLARAWSRFQAILDLVRERFHVREKLTRLQELAADHPIQALFVAVMLSMSSIPIVGFIVFSCFTMIVTFTTFICIEGFLLSIGAIILGIAILIFALVGVCMSCLILAVASAVMGGRQAYSQLNSQPISTQIHNLYTFILQKFYLFSDQSIRNTAIVEVPVQTGRTHED